MVAMQRSVTDAFAEAVQMFFKTQPLPETLPQTAMRPATPAEGLQGTGHRACDCLLCACVVSISRLPDLMPRLSQALEARGSCVPQFTLMCLSGNCNDACAHAKSLSHTLWGLVFTRPLAQNIELYVSQARGKNVRFAPSQDKSQAICK